MFIREFNNTETVSIIFGRFNPPHQGHRAAWQQASRSTYWYIGTNQNTQGPKDPLPFNVKVNAMLAIWPEAEGHVVAEQNWLTLAVRAYKNHGNIKLYCLTDEDWVTPTIAKYNGVEAAHGYYKFSAIEQQKTPRLSSASALRDAVHNNDRKAFAAAAGVSADISIENVPYFDLVAHYLSQYENTPKKASAKKKELTTEAAYTGNIGIMELIEFFKTADQELVKKVKELIAAHEDKSAWKLIQTQTQSNLVGPEFDRDEVTTPPGQHSMDELDRLKQLAGVGSDLKIYDVTGPEATSIDRAKLMKEHNIKPGTDAWFKLWFARPKLTGEQPI